ncbi:MAG: SRPBCC family protein [Mycobacteriales bacterium]
MAITRRFMRGVTPTQVFDVLRDGRSYGHWVVGTRTIRAVDAGWPAEGSRLHYTVGYGPLRKDDETVSCAYGPDTRLELEAHAWPAGTARVVLQAEPGDGGTRVSIEEEPLRGWARRLHNPAADVLIKVRNVESLRRLEQQARRQ